MSVSEFEMIRRLKKGAIDRCRERVVAARLATEGGCQKVELIIPQEGLLKRWKEHHGL